MSSSRKHPLQTELLHIGQAVCDAQHDGVSVSEPVVRTSTVRFHSVDALQAASHEAHSGGRQVVYGRRGLPTRMALEDIFCALEEGERAWLAPSGLAAITTALQSLLQAGDHLILSDGVYGPVRNFATVILEKFGVECSFVDLSDPQTLPQHIRPNTRGLYLEVPTSLLLQMHDLPALAAIAHAHNMWVMADNSWGSGLMYTPLALGADISCIAATKYVNGHSDCLLGAVVARDAALIERLEAGHYALGISVSADDAYLVSRGSRTMKVRMEQHARHALQVCDFLQTLPEVDRIYHPAYDKDPGHALWKRDAKGSNGLLSVGLRLSAQEMKRFVDALELFSIGFSWGGYESLIQWVDECALKVHSYWSKDGTQIARLHIGLEDPEDLCQDIQQALKAAKQGA